MNFRQFAILETEPELLCGEGVPAGRLPPVSWFCAKLNMWATSDEELKEMSRRNNNCPGCIVEEHEIGKCTANPHRRVR